MFKPTHSRASRCAQARKWRNIENKLMIFHSRPVGLSVGSQSPGASPRTFSARRIIKSCFSCVHLWEHFVYDYYKLTKMFKLTYNRASRCAQARKWWNIDFFNDFAFWASWADGCITGSRSLPQQISSSRNHQNLFFARAPFRILCLWILETN